MRLDRTVAKINIMGICGPRYYFGVAPPKRPLRPLGEGDGPGLGWATHHILRSCPIVRSLLRQASLFPALNDQLIPSLSLLFFPSPSVKDLTQAGLAGLGFQPPSLSTRAAVLYQLPLLPRADWSEFTAARFSSTRRPSRRILPCDCIILLRQTSGLAVHARSTFF